VSLLGGRGRLHGALIGSAILGVLSTGLTLMNVQFFTQLLIPQPQAPLPANL
jgi:ribose transport system permease protein